MKLTNNATRSVFLGMLCASISTYAATWSLNVNQEAITFDRNLSLTYSAVPTGTEAGSSVDLYFGLQLPSGPLFTMNGSGGWIAGLTPAKTIAKFAETTNANIFSMQVPIDIPSGTYTFYMASTRTGADISDPASWSSIANKSISISAPPLAKKVPLATTLQPWFHGYISTGDGNEVLALTTMSDFAHQTPATPMMLLKSSIEGATDVTSQFFATAPNFFWARNVVSFKDPTTNSPAFWVCSQGRETQPMPPNPRPDINGVWMEQDQLFVLKNGKFVDMTSMLPQVNDFSHGCTSAHTGDGNTVELVKNTLGTFGGNPPQQVLYFDGSKYSRANPNPDLLYNPRAKWWVGAADFAKTGNDWLVFSQEVVRNTAGKYELVQVLSAPDLELEGYTNYHSGAIGDVNNDGYPDVLLVLSGDGIKKPFLGGAKLALFVNDGTGNLVYKPSAIPAHTSIEFGLDLRIMDINFDGYPDIVTSGATYRYGAENLKYPDDMVASAVMINKGNAEFEKRKIFDPELDARCKEGEPGSGVGCQSALYFMRTTSKETYNVIGYGGGPNGPFFYGRSVSKDRPLGLQ